MKRFALLGVVLVLWGACAAPPLAASPEASVLRVGTSGDYPPFSAWEAGRVRGFSATVVEAYATERGRRVEWVRFRWPELVGDMEAGRFALAESGITVRPERSLRGRYSVPVARNGAVLLLRRPEWAAGVTGEPLAQVRALDRPALRVAVNQGGHLERVARAHFQQAQVVAIADNAGVRRALAEGRVDAALTNTVEAPRWAEGLEGVEAVGPFTRDVVALYVNAAESRLAEDVDGWLLAQEAKGTLGRWRAEHLGAGAAELVAQPVEALLAATAERLSLMPWVAAAKQQAGQPVEDLAQEAKVLKASREQVHQAAQAQGVPAPTDEALTRFFQAQMEAAKAVQRRAPLAAGAPVPSLEKELRPAVARISARMSTLVPRVPGGLEREATRRKARDWLATSGLTQEEMDGLADALVALGGR